MEARQMSRSSLWFYWMSNWGQFNTFDLRSNHFWEPILFMHLRFHCYISRCYSLLLWLLSCIDKNCGFWENQWNEDAIWFHCHLYGYLIDHISSFDFQFLIFQHQLLTSFCSSFVRKDLVTYVNVECIQYNE